MSENGPVTRDVSPKRLTCLLEDNWIQLQPKKFATGSRGWHGQQKLLVQGERCQVNILITVIGSKPGTSTETQPEQPLTKPKKPRKASKTPSEPEVASDPFAGWQRAEPA